MRLFTSTFVHTADFVQHTEIVLQGTLSGDYILRLFMKNEELELQTQDNQTWTPTQRPYIPYFFTTNTWWWLCMCSGFSMTSEMRVVIQKRSSRFFWAKKRLKSELIDAQALLNDYWSSTKHQFTVPSKSSSPTSPLVSHHEAQRTLS